MSRDSEDKNIKKMAQLLREGATMLDLTCPQCNNIIFKLKSGKKFCPSCNKEILFESEFEKVKPQEITEQKFDEIGLKGEILIIKKKISKICKLIEENDQLTNIRELLDILEKLLGIYQKMSHL
jgi:UPF0148 protein